MFACSDDANTEGSSTDGTGSETGDGDGDPTGDEDSTSNMGDGDGDATGDGDGDPATGDGDGDPTGDGDGDPTGDGDGDPTGDGDGDPTGDGDGDPNEDVCGDGEVTGPEVCDDGVNDGAYGGCAEDCSALAPYCGDAEVNGPETCDDGVNDGTYDGCADTCLELGPYCGDAEINGNETCDDANDDSSDGCLGSCEIPGSCLDILDYDDQLMDGPYAIAPEGYQGDAFGVHCDMLSDGGGYTFLKVMPMGPTYADDAELLCADLGMQLWIPRSEEHVLSGWAISNDDVIGPDASVEYMRILGIYSDMDGATCNLQPMNSDNDNCNWGASDGEAWWVHERNNINEPNGDNTTVGSMYYLWNQDGSLNHHNDINGPGGRGYTSGRFMCDVGDKLP